MDLDTLITRVKNIIMQPAQEWEKIALEQTKRNDILFKYALPLIILGAISAFIGNAFLSDYHSVSSGIVFALDYFVGLLLGIYVFAVIVNELTIGFGSEKNLDASYKLVIYSYTAYLASSVLANLHTSLSFIHLFSLYSIYLLWIGITPLMKTPDDKKVGFVIIIVLVGFVVSILVTAVLNIIAAPFLRGVFL